MIARFDWQWRYGAPQRKVDRSPRMSYQVGGVLLAGLTAVYLLWLLFHYGLAAAGFAALPAILGEMMQLLETSGAVTLAVLWGVGLWQWQRPFSTKKVTQDHARTLNELYDLDPLEFEQYVAQLFRQKGYTVTHRGRSGDKGVDLELVKTGGKRAIVQCKRYHRPIGPEVVRELFGTLIHERVSHAFLVTTADISKSAREWAQDKPITLIDGSLLAQVSEKLLQKE
jgi:restriction system protein